MQIYKTLLIALSYSYLTIYILVIVDVIDAVHQVMYFRL